VLLAAWCGLRFGELAELRRSDLDLKNARIKIRRAVVRANGKVIIGPPKSDAGVRDVAIPPHLLPVVKSHITDHAEFGRDGLLFPATEGGHLTPSSLCLGSGSCSVMCRLSGLSGFVILPDYRGRGGLGGRTGVIRSRRGRTGPRAR
jgi:integrase